MRTYPKCPICHGKVLGHERELQELRPDLDNPDTLTPYKIMYPAGLVILPCRHLLPPAFYFEARDRAGTIWWSTRSRNAEGWTLALALDG